MEIFYWPARIYFSVVLIGMPLWGSRRSWSSVKCGIVTAIAFITPVVLILTFGFLLTLADGSETLATSGSDYLWFLASAVFGTVVLAGAVAGIVAGMRLIGDFLPRHSTYRPEDDGLGALIREAELLDMPGAEDGRPIGGWTKSSAFFVQTEAAGAPVGIWVYSLNVPVSRARSSKPVASLQIRPPMKHSL